MGKGDNRFAPNDYITKAEATVAIIRAHGFRITGTRSGGSHKFSR